MNFLSRLFRKNAKPSAPRHGGDGMVSLVALVPEWTERSVDSVREDLDALFPGQYMPAREEGSFVIDGPVAGASFMAQCSVPKYEGIFLIHNVPSPYSAFSDYLLHLRDPELRRLAEGQQCWMSVDLMHGYSTNEDAYRFIGAALAKLAPQDAAILLHPSLYHATRFTSEVRRQLASGGAPFGTA